MSADRFAPWLDELVALRRDLHAHPELGFEEHRTAALVAERLAAYGVDEVHTGIAGTGVVGVVRGTGGRHPGGGSNRAIGLRADMDALPIREATGLAWASRNEGKMHACGHDGHTTMLLGAARWLAANRAAFDGTVYLIFQPAEEIAGGRVMVAEGLFERFACEQVYGMHNRPGLPLGRIALRGGPCMAASDVFRIAIRGKGGHGAMPHLTRDPVLIAAHVVTALQAITSRRVDPLKTAVVSATRVHVGDAFNVISEEAEIGGTCRTFLPEVRDLVEAELLRLVPRIAHAFGAEAEVEYGRRCPATVNSPEETQLAAAAAVLAVGADAVDSDGEPMMAAEDFSYMLEQRPGCYVWLGNGQVGEPGGAMLHSPGYDFNDAALAIGAGYWTRLVETVLPGSAPAGQE
jgi:amidohydrolase